MSNNRNSLHEEPISELDGNTNSQLTKQNFCCVNVTVLHSEEWDHVILKDIARHRGFIFLYKFISFHVISRYILLKNRFVIRHFLMRLQSALYRNIKNGEDFVIQIYIYLIRAFSSHF